MLMQRWPVESSMREYVHFANFAILLFQAICLFNGTPKIIFGLHSFHQDRVVLGVESVLVFYESLTRPNSNGLGGCTNALLQITAPSLPGYEACPPSHWNPPRFGL